MNLEKLGILVFLKQFQQLEPIKKHVLASVREILLAMAESIDMTNQVASEAQILQKFQGIDHLLTLLGTVVRFSAKQVSQASDSRVENKEDSIRKEIVSSIITAIDEEIEHVSDGHEENKQLKLDALMTVRKVFVRQYKTEPVSIDEMINMEKAANQ